MEPQSDKPWLRNAPNELIVNSILAAISAIVVQMIVASDQPKYGVGWLIGALASLLLFVISTEQLGESIREINLGFYIRSSIIFNVGVLLLFISLCAIFKRYSELNMGWSIVTFIIVISSWAWFWGFDTVFLIFRGEYYDRWKRKMDGQIVDEAILDYREILIARIRRSRR
jgi:hypothetical protein